MKSIKIQTIDRGLFWYGGLVTFALTSFALLNLKNQASLLSLVLFLPVFIYFAIRIFVSLKDLFHQYLNLDQKRHPYFGNFSIVTFLSQTETSFLLNIFLLSLATAIILIRLSVQILK